MSTDKSTETRTGYRIVESRGGRPGGEYPVITAVTDNAYENELAIAFNRIDRGDWLIHPGYITRTLADAGYLFSLQAPDENTAREWVGFIAALYVKAVRS